MNTLMADCLMPSTVPLKPISYPARPLQGGPFDKARPKVGDWDYEPKWNDWRAVLHVPSGTLFNRHGQAFESSFARLFRSAIEQVCARLTRREIWLDCGALGRRHTVSAGTLIVFDLIVANTARVHRRAALESAFEMWTQLDTPPPPKAVFLTPTYAAADASTLWLELKRATEVIGYAEPENVFYEGMVAKRCDSHYPVQLRSADNPFHGWMKHRFI